MSELRIPNETVPGDSHDFTAKVADNGCVYMCQAYRDICLLPKDARILARWILQNVEPEEKTT